MEKIQALLRSDDMEMVLLGVKLLFTLDKAHWSHMLDEGRRRWEAPDGFYNAWWWYIRKNKAITILTRDKDLPYIVTNPYKDEQASRDDSKQRPRDEETGDNTDVQRTLQYVERYPQ